MGCATAYQLARLGWQDVVLLERAELTSGSTFHAAGLVGQLRSSASITQLLGHSIKLYETIEAETGQATGWKRCGGLRLACNRERLQELRRQATTAKSFGLEVHMLTPKEAQQLWPPMVVDDVVGAAFLPMDGTASPSDVTMALAKGARMRGVRIVENCPVTSVELKNGRVRAVGTPQGLIECEVLVNCAGRWAREFGRLAGVNVPVVSVEHQFLITEPIAGVTSDLPTLRDPDRLTYYKEEVGGLIMGGYEPNPIALDGSPDDQAFRLLPSNHDHFEQLAELAMQRVPALADVGINKLINGPEAFTPDGYFLLGEAPEVRNYFVGAGFNAFGIAAAGGAGWALAEWIVNGEPPYDLWPVDIRRFSHAQRDSRWISNRTLEMYGKHYTMAWPHEEHESGRPLRRSPLYEHLRGHGACFGEKMAWERPNWFAPEGVEARDIYSFGRQNWFLHVGSEHVAARERVALFDETSFGKLQIVGRDAERALQWICAGDVSKPPGHLIYTQLLNSRGGIESDVTVARLGADEFTITTGTAFVEHDRHWIERNLPDDADVAVIDVTSSRAVLGLMGPRARDVLAALTDEDISNDAFPFSAVREISVAGAPVLALRVTFVGELGWELHIPQEYATRVYEALLETGSQHGIANAGYRAINSLRLEKGYRVWGADLTPDHTPLEAGLGWATKLKTNVPFLGREALEKQQQQQLTKSLATFTADPDVVLLGRETIYRDQQQVGWLTSGGYGYTVEKSIGYGYVRRAEGLDRDWLLAGSYELEVAGERVPAAIHCQPLYDPKMERIKC